MKIVIINGPNLNMLDYREQHIYGNKSLDDINLDIKKYKPEIKFDFYQSNYEGDIINKIHEVIKSKEKSLIINPGAFSHYSYAIHDALDMFKGCKVEVHLSNIKQREEFRQNLVTAAAVDKVFSGFGYKSYFKAIDYIIKGD